jgi:hypothetical protein
VCWNILVLGGNYLELLDDRGGALRRVVLEGEHGVIALEVKVSVQLRLRSNIISKTYVESREAASVCIELLVVELDELLYAEIQSRLTVGMPRFQIRWVRNGIACESYGDHLRAMLWKSTAVRISLLRDRGGPGARIVPKLTCTSHD